MKVQYSVGAFLFMTLLVAQTGVAAAATTASIFPTGDGSNLGFTGSATGTHYTLVDDTPCNGVTDYVSATVVGKRDSYQVSLASVPNGAVITSVLLKPCASRNSSGSGSAGLGVFYKFNGATSSDSIYTLATGITPVVLATSTFSNLSFTKNASSTLEAGVVYSSGTTGARVSNLATVLTYITAAPVAPTNLRATTTMSSSSRTALLSWTDNSSEEQGYFVERGTDGIIFNVIASTTANTVSYADFTPAASTTYYYRVRAFNVFGFSDYATTTPVSF
jgi:hypothetical protein